MNILQIDQNILVAVNSFFVGKSKLLDEIVAFFAVYLVYLLPIILVWMWFRYKKNRLQIFLAFLGTIIAWLLITKLIVPSIWFRARPDLAAIGIKELLFHRPDYSFPSDHATALFGLTFGFYLFGWKKAGYWFLAYAIIISFFRIVIGVHFPLDIIAGAFSGFIGVYLVKIFAKPAEKYLYNPIIKMMKKLRIP